MSTKLTIFWLSMSACGVSTYAMTQQYLDLPIVAAAEDDCAVYHGARVLKRVEPRHDANGKRAGVTCFYRL